jgi:hypothetical protein
MGGDLTYRYEDGRSIFELSLPLAGSEVVASESTLRSADIS